MTQLSQNQLLRPEFRPTLVPNTLIRRLGDESIVWAPDSPNPVYLDPVASLLTSTFDGVGTRVELIDEICEIFEVGEVLAAAQLDRVMHGLNIGGVLHNPEIAPSGQTLSRALLPEPNW